MPYYLAVDAGGTKTEFLLAEDDRELGRAVTGTIKRVNADAETAAATCAMHSPNWNEPPACP